MLSTMIVDNHSLLVGVDFLSSGSSEFWAWKPS